MSVVRVGILVGSIVLSICRRRFGRRNGQDAAEKRLLQAIRHRGELLGPAVVLRLTFGVTGRYGWYGRNGNDESYDDGKSLTTLSPRFPLSRTVSVYFGPLERQAEWFLSPCCESY